MAKANSGPPEPPGATRRAGAPARARSAADKPRERSGRVRSAGDLIGEVGGVAFKRFGFVQSAVVSRWPEIVGERYARVSAPESIRFPSGRKSGGTLSLLVEGAHAPLLQHLGPMIIERVNRFFGYAAIARISFHQGRPSAAARAPVRPEPKPIPQAIGEGLREISDPELRACLESLASHLSSSNGPPLLDPAPELPQTPKTPEHLR